MINFENNPRDPLVTEENMYNFFPKQEKIGRAKDLTNLQFGELLVLYKTDSQKIGNATKPMQVCKCKRCGNIVKRRGDHLYQNKLISCGCPNPINIAGQKFDHLIPIKIERYDSNNGYIQECQCDCGNKCFVSYCNLNTQRVLECPFCSRRRAMIKLGKQGSKGSNKIKKILDNNNIKYELEKSFIDLKDKNFLFYDFYLPEYNILIEYDGQQHFKEGSETSMMCNKEKFKETLLHDKIKNDYAIKNNIPLIRIPYYDINNIQINDLITITSKYNILQKMTTQIYPLPRWVDTGDYMPNWEPVMCSTDKTN